MTVHEIRMDRTKPLAAQAERGHNRWHPDIPAVLRVAPGDEVVVDTVDAADAQLSPESTAADLAQANLNRVHPLTGQDFDQPFLALWRLADGYAVSPDLPGVRIAADPFLGTFGVAPSRALLGEITAREQALLAAGGPVMPPEPADALPADPVIAAEGLRTMPPRENAGNVDIPQTGVGARLLLPVWTAGALFSAGDGHFAQGEGEACGTAIEMTGTWRLRFDLRKREAAERRATPDALRAAAGGSEPRRDRPVLRHHRHLRRPGGGQSRRGRDCRHPRRPTALLPLDIFE